MNAFVDEEKRMTERMKWKMTMRMLYNSFPVGLQNFVEGDTSTQQVEEVFVKKKEMKKREEMMLLQTLSLLYSKIHFLFVHGGKKRRKRKKRLKMRESDADIKLFYFVCDRSKLPNWLKNDTEMH